MSCFKHCLTWLPSGSVSQSVTQFCFVTFWHSGNILMWSSSRSTCGSQASLDTIGIFNYRCLSRTWQTRPYMERVPVSTPSPQTSWQQVVRSSPGLECMVKQFTNCRKDINPTSCSSTPRLHLVYGDTWGEGKYNPSLKTIFFGQKMFFFFRKQISTEDPRHTKGLDM